MALFIFYLPPFVKKFNNRGTYIFSILESSNKAIKIAHYYYVAITLSLHSLYL